MTQEEMAATAAETDGWYIEDEVRVLRVMEYIGPRSIVEEHFRHSSVPLNGGRAFGQLQIHSAPVGQFPMVIGSALDGLYSDSLGGD